MNQVREILNNAVHGHEKAKTQIERILAQWINGEQTGYSFGFEGPPGTGKTSFAKKGLANCLKDDNGECRPFSFIAIGGQDNGSTLNGHNYTYVGSEWGKFVDILIKHKCMNPIIFIDELDKVSKTEHGKEIIGILTHLIDPTQNDVFQDKYFNGIDLDLSKALFIFSYNDVSAIDKILLDRIHRIKFEHLTIEDKLVITKKHILPEIYKNMGLEGCIEISDENIIYVVENYTNEPGIRKFKELLFDIIGEINLSCLKSFESTELPIKITNEDIKYKYLKNYHENLLKKIPFQSQVGVINGLWANSMGQGGIIPIEVKFFPSTTFFDLKLTGLQGDVMKESMTVAKTLATSLVEKDKLKTVIKDCEESKLQGIHIHCPEGSVPKDGPSAGTAITSAIYSLLSGRKIKNTIAITGEINLQGCVTAIGGLDLKILGGLKGGVREFIYPKENEKDYKDFVEKYKDKNILDDIKFHKVEYISEVLNIILED
jgi:ATP-dependent Lon protease